MRSHARTDGQIRVKNWLPDIPVVSKRSRCQTENAERSPAKTPDFTRRTQG